MPSLSPSVPIRGGGVPSSNPTRNKSWHRRGVGVRATRIARSCITRRGTLATIPFRCQVECAHLSLKLPAARHEPEQLVAPIVILHKVDEPCARDALLDHLARRLLPLRQRLLEPPLFSQPLLELSAEPVSELSAIALHPPLHLQRVGLGAFGLFERRIGAFGALLQSAQLRPIALVELGELGLCS